MPRGAGLFATTIAAVVVMAGTAGAASVAPNSQDFGSRNVGTTGVPTSFTLTSSQSVMGPCDIHSDPTDPTSPCTLYFWFQTTTSTTALGGGPGTTTTIGDFSIQNVDCPASGLMSPYGAPATNSCHFDASFAPVADGARSQTLTFSDTNGPPAVLTLTGTGIAPSGMSTGTAGATGGKRCKHKHRHASAAKKCKKKR